MKPIALLWTPIQRKLQASELGIHNQASHPSTVFPVEKNQTPGSFTFPNNEPGNHCLMLHVHKSLMSIAEESMSVNEIDYVPSADTLVSQCNDNDWPHTSWVNN